MFNSESLKCERCSRSCKYQNQDCNMFLDKTTSIKELNRLIKEKHLDLVRFARDNGLKYKYLKRMLNQEQPMKYRTLTLLTNELNKGAEWLDYVGNF